MSTSSWLRDLKLDRSRASRQRRNRRARSQFARRLERLEDRLLLAVMFGGDQYGPSEWRLEHGSSQYAELHHGRRGSFEFVWEPLPSDIGSPDAAPTEGSQPAAAAALNSLDSIPVLHSNPGAPATVFLDFDGHSEPVWGAWEEVPTRVYDVDGDETTFSDDELNRIQEMWVRVAEDFAPFNVDVTTVEPAVLDEDSSIGDANGVALRIAIGGSWEDWYGSSAGGVGYVNSFTSSIANVVYVFSDNRAGGNARSVAEAASHEAGHGFGLSHQSLYDGNGVKLEEYNPGDSTWAPLMGGGAGNTTVVSTWYNGTSTAGSTVFQDDLAILAGGTNGFGYRIDDHGDTTTSAPTSLSIVGSTWSGAGLVETNDDVDVFSFTVTSEDTYRVSVDVDPLAPNLDVVLELHDGTGLIATADPAQTLDAHVVEGLTPGEYFVSVTKPATYGWIGQYTVDVVTPPAGISVTQDDVPLTTGEDGRSATVDVVLDTKPTANVIVPISSSDPTEGTVSASSLTFTPANWNVKQTVTVSGADDSTVDGSATYSVLLGPTSSGDSDYSGRDPADVSVINVDNDAPGWAFSIGGTPTSFDRGAINVDDDGNIYVLTVFKGTVDFDPGPGTFELTDRGGTNGDGAIAKYTRDGQLVWANSFGGDGTERVKAVELDAAGNVYISGSSYSSTVEFGNITLTTAGSSDAYLAKLDSNGNFLWAHNFGGSGADTALDISVSDAGDVLVAGGFQDQVDFDPSPGNVVNLTSVGGTDAAVWKLDTNGNFQWARSFGGPEADTAVRLSTDAAGNIYVTGTFKETVDFGTDTFTSATPDQFDTYLLKLDTLGNTTWARHVSGVDLVGYARLTVSASGSIYTAGSFDGTADVGGTTLTSTALRDAYVAKWNADGTLVWARQFNGTSYVYLQKMVADADDNVYIAGRFKGTADFDPDAGAEFNLTSPNDRLDGVLVQLDSAGDFVTAYHSTGPDWVRTPDLAVGDDGNIYSIGSFVESVALPTGDFLAAGALRDTYVLKLNMSPGITVSPTSGLVTTESGGSAMFSVVLDTPPTADVTIGLSSDDGSEGTVVPATLTFTPTNWNVAQSVTVSGVDDAVVDGDTAYSIVTAAAVSSDDGYNGLNPSDVTVTNLDDDLPPPPTVVMYFSLNSSGSVGGLSVANEDIIAFDGSDFSLLFDGSDVGVDGLKLDAFSVLSDTEILMSFTAAATVGGVSADDSDLLLFTATSLGDATSGTFSMYFDGSDVELSSSSEDIDAVRLLDDGRLIISTTGSPSVSGVSGDADEDLLVFTPTSLGTTTAGTWAMHFDGSDVGLSSSSSEDVDAVGLDADGNIYFSTTGNFGVTGVSGADEDVFVFTPSSLGSATAGTYDSTLFFDGSAFGLSGNDIKSIDIPATDPNNAPVAASDSYSVDEDNTLDVAAQGVLSNDSDADGDSLTAVLVSGAGNGSVTLNSDGSFEYTPNTDFNGSDSFTYKADDGTSNSNLATVTITVDPVNDAPVANGQSVATDEDASVAITLTGSDVDGDTLIYSVVSGPGFGSLSGTLPNLIYTPNTNYNGNDSIAFQVNDGSVDIATAIVSITVTPINDLPVADDKSVTTDEDTSSAVTLTGSDSDGDALAYSIVSGPANGSLSGAAPNLTYTPNTDFNGPDSFTYKADDGTSDSDLATVTITVDPVNDAPVANGQPVTTDEDASVAITLTGSDVDGDSLTYSVVSGPGFGSLSGTLPNLIYTPNANFNGPDSFTYKADDGTSDSNLATVTITVDPVNDPPTISDISDQTIDEDTSTTALTLTIGDLETPASSLTLSGSSSNTTLVPSANIVFGGSGANRTVTVTPAADQFGTTTINVTVSDGSDSVQDTFVLTVSSVNDAPVADAQSVFAKENTDKPITLTASDVDGDSLTYKVVSGPANGVLSGTAPDLTYTPDENFNGSDSFTFNANDETDDSDDVTVSITVAANNPPVANAQSVSVTEDTTLAITLTGTDPDGDPITYSVVSGPTDSLSGTAPNLTYTPSADFNGPDSFTFIVNDGTDDSATAIVSIMVTPANDAPGADAQSVTTNEDTSVAITLTGSDIDGDALTYMVVGGPANGSLSGTAPNLTYTPGADVNGSDSFRFKVNDGNVDSVTATVSITVSPVNDAPIANVQSVTTNEDASAAITLTGSDIDGDTLTYSIVGGPANGSLSGTAPNLTYTPSDDFNGSDSFSFNVDDGNAGIATATILITVTPVNDAPSSDDHSTATNEDTPVAILLTASDIDGDPLTYSIVGGPANGSLSGTAQNLTYTPGTDYHGPDSFTFRVNDGSVNSSVATVSITVSAVNDAPVAASDSYSVDQNTPLSVSAAGVLGNDGDADGDALTAVLVDGPSNGVLALSSNGSFTYTPSGGFTGADSFTYQAKDGSANSNLATVSITVNAISGTKFFVVDNGGDDTFEYDAAGTSLTGDTWNLDTGNVDPRGATSNLAGNKVWVVDKNDKVYVYDGDGVSQGSWAAGGLNEAEGIATDGTHIWILDKRARRILRYDNAATTGDAGVDFSFSLNGANRKAKGITTDGTSLWVVNDDRNSDKVFKYNASNGALSGSWTINSANSKPTGITIDPSGASTSIWIVDKDKDSVYEYGNALGNTGGGLIGSFALASGNTNPEGIADPPPAQLPSASESVPAALLADEYSTAAAWGSLRPSADEPERFEWTTPRRSSSEAVTNDRLWQERSADSRTDVSVHQRLEGSRLHRSASDQALVELTEYDPLDDDLITDVARALSKLR